MWSDNETEIDLLSVKHLVGAVTDTIKNNKLLPTTIGVFGDWGSGKSSLVSMVKQDLAGDESVFCISFNGWLFEDYEDAKAALMGTIIDEIRERRTLTAKAKEKIQNLLSRVKWLSVAGTVGKQALSYAIAHHTGLPPVHVADISNITMQQTVDAVKTVTDQVDPAKAKEMIEDTPGGEDNVRKNIRDFRKDFAELLEETKIKTLVVFIDDLDRCLPDTVVETLEAIKLFLFTPQTVFVISADERLVELAVEHRFPDPAALPEDKLSRNYLEKLIQFPVRIPPLGPAEVLTYMNLMFAQLRLSPKEFQTILENLPKGADNGLWGLVLDKDWFGKIIITIPPELTDDLTLTEQVGNVLAETLNGNPRQIKRFLNAILLRINMAKSRGVDLKKRVLAKLMALEYKNPEAFKALAQTQSKSEGKPEVLKLMEEAVRKTTADTKEEVEKDKKSKTGKTVQDELEIDDQEFSHWIKEAWLKNWLSLEPILNTDDLRPYFYVSRDKLGVMQKNGSNLSKTVQDTLGLFLSGSIAHNRQGVSKIILLPLDEANVVLKAFTKKIDAEEDQATTGRQIGLLLDIATSKSELFSSVLKILEQLSDSKFIAGNCIKLVGLKATHATEAPQIVALLQKWSTSTSNLALKAGAASALIR